MSRKRKRWNIHRLRFRLANRDNASISLPSKPIMPYDCFGLNPPRFASFAWPRLNALCWGVKRC